MLRHNMLCLLLMCQPTTNPFQTMEQRTFITLENWSQHLKILPISAYVISLIFSNVIKVQRLHSAQPATSTSHIKLCGPTFSPKIPYQDHVGLVTRKNANFAINRFYSWENEQLLFWAPQKKVIVDLQMFECICLKLSKIVSNCP